MKFFLSFYFFVYNTNFLENPFIACKMKQGMEFRNEINLSFIFVSSSFLTSLVP